MENQGDQEEGQNLIEKQNDQQKELTIEPLDYEFLNGLRGIGALVVYFHHFAENRYVMCKEGDCDNNPGPQPDWYLSYKNSPFQVFTAANAFVNVFFILSGFVLPISWFKGRKTSSITGATFRRYLRLMLPMIVMISIFYFVAKMDIPRDPKTFKEIKHK